VRFKCYYWSTAYQIELLLAVWFVKVNFDSCIGTRHKFFS